MTESIFTLEYFRNELDIQIEQISILGSSPRVNTSPLFVGITGASIVLPGLGVRKIKLHSQCHQQSK